MARRKQSATMVAFLREQMEEALKPDNGAMPEDILGEKLEAFHPHAARNRGGIKRQLLRNKCKSKSLFIL